MITDDDRRRVIVMTMDVVPLSDGSADAMVMLMATAMLAVMAIVMVNVSARRL